MVVGAMCLDCYPKMQKTTKRGNVTCYVLIFMAIVTVITLIIINNTGDDSEISLANNVTDSTTTIPDSN